jgi:hypothetical protein
MNRIWRITRIIFVGFGLDNKLLIDDHVQSLLRELVPLVKDWYGNLTCYSMFALNQLSLQSHHVDVLEESKAEGVVNIEERSDHRTREPFFNQFVSGHALKVAR